MMHLNGRVKITRVMNAVAAGTSDQNGSTLDMSGFDGVLFVAAFGTLTSTQVTKIKAQQGAASDLSDAADLAGSEAGPLTDSDGNKLLVLDVHKPTERYVRVVVDRGTANAVIDGVIAIQYGGRVAPVSHAASVMDSATITGAAEGTP